jgi:hypothetical protein
LRLSENEVRRAEVSEKDFWLAMVVISSIATGAVGVLFILQTIAFLN